MINLFLFISNLLFFIIIIKLYNELSSQQLTSNAWKNECSYWIAKEAKLRAKCDLYHKEEK